MADAGSEKEWRKRDYRQAKIALDNKRGASGVDIAVAILISVVIGALLLAGLYLLFDQTVLPTLKQKIEGMFNYSGAAGS